MKKVIFGILIALVSTVIFGILITVVSLAAFAEKTNHTSEIKAETKIQPALVSLSGNVIDEVSLVTSYTSYNKKEKSFTINSTTNQVKIELQASK